MLAVHITRVRCGRRKEEGKEREGRQRPQTGESVQKCRPISLSHLAKAQRQCPPPAPTGEQPFLPLIFPSGCPGGLDVRHRTKWQGDEAERGVLLGGTAPACSPGWSHPEAGPGGLRALGGGCWRLCFVLGPGLGPDERPKEQREPGAALGRPCTC